MVACCDVVVEVRATESESAPVLRSGSFWLPGLAGALPRLALAITIVSKTIKADVRSLGVRIIGARAAAGIHSEVRLAAETAAWVGGLRVGLVEGKREREADLEEGAEFCGDK